MEYLADTCQILSSKKPPSTLCSKALPAFWIKMTATYSIHSWGPHLFQPHLSGLSSYISAWGKFKEKERLHRVKSKSKVDKGYSLGSYPIHRKSRSSVNLPSAPYQKDPPHCHLFHPASGIRHLQ